MGVPLRAEEPDTGRADSGVRRAGVPAACQRRAENAQLETPAAGSPLPISELYQGNLALTSIADRHAPKVPHK